MDELCWPISINIFVPVKNKYIIIQWAEPGRSEYTQTHTHTHTLAIESRLIRLLQMNWKMAWIFLVSLTIIRKDKT